MKPESSPSFQDVLPVPCILVTGALGSGKTTFIRELLRQPELSQTALIINEFGEVGIDNFLVSSAVESTVLMENGCLCCSLRGDVVDAILGLLSSREKGNVPDFRRIVIETTGLADPLPILRDISSSAALAGKIVMDRVITTVDSLIAESALREADAMVSQVAQADICLLTKCDLADPMAVDSLHDTLAAINPLMTIRDVRGGLYDSSMVPLIIDPAPVLRSPSLDRLGNGGEGCADPDCPCHQGHNDHHHGHGDHHHHDGHEHRHVHGSTSSEHDHALRHDAVTSWSCEFDAPLPWNLLRDWFKLLYSLRPADLLRMKGILWIEGHDRPVVVQAVGPIFNPLVELDGWPGGKPHGRLVVIARNLHAAAIEQSFEDVVLARRDGSSFRRDLKATGSDAA